MTYAPVCIPTLNRYEHLRKCLESLSRCTGADQTEVYVALDYPPLDKWDKYAPGWEKNREFLHSCGDMGFKKLHVIEREENYGTWLPGDKGNLKVLLNEVIYPKYDGYITTEDDNIFAPNYLMYVNKGLEKFHDDDTILSLTGYRYFFPYQYSENTFIKSFGFNPWGVATWTKKQLATPKLTKNWYRLQLSVCNSIKVYRRLGLNGLISFWNSCTTRWNGMVIDNNIGVYQALTGKWQIFPREFLVKNIGMDGSGVTFGLLDPQLQAQFDAVQLSTNTDYQFIGTGLENASTNKKIGQQYDILRQPFGIRVKRFIKGLIKLFVFK